MKNEKLPNDVKAVLVDSVYKREDQALVGPALEKLGVEVVDSFREFFEVYEGPFGSSNTGFELLDLCDMSDDNIIASTEICRVEYGFPKEILVISNYLGNGVLVYDSERDLVFTIDFEGTDQELLQGKLTPDWKSFYDFLDFFFCCNK